MHKRKPYAVSILFNSFSTYNQLTWACSNCGVILCIEKLISANFRDDFFFSLVHFSVNLTTDLDVY